MFTKDEIEVITSIVNRRLTEIGLRRLMGQVASVSGDAASGYYVTLYLAGDTSHASARVRCLRHYTPQVGDRVSVLALSSTLLEVLGKIN